jgi:sulfoxide reductase heme-binding subunit YedZ
VRNAQASVHLVAASVGFISLFLLWLTVCWGIVLRGGWASTRIRHATSYGTHMTLALLGLNLGVVHALAQLAVPRGPVGWLDEWVPFLNRTDPVGVGIGVIALELMLAFALSMLVQRRIGYHRWHSLHRVAYLAFGLMVGHVLLAGSDVGSRWVQGVVAAGALAVALLWLSTSGAVAAARRRIGGALSGRSRALVTTVSVDRTRCVRFGFCEHEAPEVFQLRNDGILIYRPTVPPERVEDAIRAVSSCPARAIMLGRQATAVVVPRPTSTGRPQPVPLSADPLASESLPVDPQTPGALTIDPLGGPRPVRAPRHAQRGTRSYHRDGA